MNVSTFKGKKCPFSYVRYHGANQINGAQDIKTAVSIMAAKVSFRQVQFVSPTVQFTLQEFFSSLQFYVRYFLSLSLTLAWFSFFSFLPPSPYPFSDILKEKKLLARARSQTWFSSRCCSRIASCATTTLRCTRVQLLYLWQTRKHRHHSGLANGQCVWYLNWRIRIHQAGKAVSSSDAWRQMHVKWTVIHLSRVTIKYLRKGIYNSKTPISDWS